MPPRTAHRTGGEAEEVSSAEGSANGAVDQFSREFQRQNILLPQALELEDEGAGRGKLSGAVEVCGDRHGHARSGWGVVKEAGTALREIDYACSVLCSGAGLGKRSRR